MRDKYVNLIEDNYQNEFKYTLEQCGLFLLQSSDETIGHCIFEEFDTYARTFLYDDMLERFLDEGLIDDEIMSKCMKLRSLFVNIQTNYTDLWNIKSVRISEYWRGILELSDETKESLYA